MTLKSFLVTLMTLALVGCEPQHASQPATPATSDGALTLRTYQLPPGHGEKVRPILANLLKRGDDDPVGRTAVAPGDRLLVLAPASIHAGVEQFLKEMKTSDAPLEPPPTIALTHWLVVANPGPSPEPDRCGPKGFQCLRGGPEVIKAIEAVDATHAPGDSMHYALLEQLTIRSLEGEQARLNGGAAMVSQRAGTAGGKIIADLEIRVMRKNGQELDTRLQFAPNQTVVLGQVAFSGGNEGDGAPKGMLLFVTRGTVEK